MNFSGILRRHAALTSLLCASFLLVACGSGGGDDSPGGGDGKSMASIVFPPVDSIFTGDVLVVRGTASDDGDVKSVKVNGIAATSDDGYATWLASVPLDAGSNEINVDVENSGGDVTSAADSVTVTRRVLPMAILTGIKIDAANNRAVVVDSTMNAIFGIDLDTGVRTVLSSAAIGSGPMYESVLNIDISSDGTLAYLFDWTQLAYFEINLSTGIRRVLSSPEVGSGEDFELSYDFVVDEANARSFLIVLGSGDDFHVVEVDHATGDRTWITSTGAGYYEQPLGAEWDPVLQRLLVTTLNNKLLFVDPFYGTRTEVALSGAAGASLTYDLAYDRSNNRAFVLEAGGGPLIFSVDLASGVTEIFSAGSGAELKRPNSLAYDDAGDRLLVVGYEGEVVGIDLVTKSRTLLADSGDVKAGSGDAMWSINTVAFDPANNVAYAKEGVTNRFARIDLLTGARTFPGGMPAVFGLEVDPRDNRLLGVAVNDFVSVDPASGEATFLANISDDGGINRKMRIDTAGNRVIYTSGSNISAVSLDDYSITRLASLTVGSGEEIRNPSSIVIDEQRSRLVFADSGPPELKALAESGTRTDLINSGDTATPRLLGIRDMVTDGSGNNLFALDGRNGTLMSINLDTMNRTVLAGTSAGSSASTGITNGLAVDETAGLAWSSVAGSVIVFDIIGGDHVIISR